MIELASTSALLETATTAKIESVQRQINELQLDLQMNSDILDSLQLSQIGFDTNIRYASLSMDEKKFIVNRFIDKIVLHEGNESIHIYWKI